MERGDKAAKPGARDPRRGRSEARWSERQQVEDAVEPLDPEIHWPHGIPKNSDNISSHR